MKSKVLPHLWLERFFIEKARQKTWHWGILLIFCAKWVSTVVPANAIWTPCHWTPHHESKPCGRCSWNTYRGRNIEQLSVHVCFQVWCVTVCPVQIGLYPQCKTCNCYNSSKAVRGDVLVAVQSGYCCRMDRVVRKGKMPGQYHFTALACQQLFMQPARK